MMGLCSLFLSLHNDSQPHRHKTMNLNIINLEPTEWDKQTWRDAYAGYCEHNLHGVMTKREYYDWVLARCERRKMLTQPLSDELKRKWTIGKQNARLWAKRRGCDMNGRLLLDVRTEKENNTAINIANRAEDIALDTMQQLDILLNKVGQKKE